MGSFYVPGTILSTEDAAMNVQPKTPFPCKAHLLVSVITTYGNSNDNSENLETVPLIYPHPALAT